MIDIFMRHSKWAEWSSSESLNVYPFQRAHYHRLVVIVVSPHWIPPIPTLLFAKKKKKCNYYDTGFQCSQWPQTVIRWYSFKIDPILLEKNSKKLQKVKRKTNCKTDELSIQDESIVSFKCFINRCINFLSDRCV